MLTEESQLACACCSSALDNHEGRQQRSVAGFLGLDNDSHR